MWNKNFILLWIGQAVSQLGSRIYLMAIAWYFVAKLGNSQAAIIMFIASSLPSLLFGVAVGPIIEQFNKKKIIIICDMLSFLLTSLLAYMTYRGVATEWIIYLVCFLLSTVTLFFSPSINSIIPSIIPEKYYTRGVSMIKIVGVLGQIMGAAVGGILVGFLGVFWSIAINAISFLISGIASMYITYKPQIQKQTTSYIAQLKAGFTYIKEQVEIKYMVMIAIMTNLFLPTFVVFIPIIVKNEMNLDSLHYGIADAAIPVGSFVIGLLMSTLNISNKKPIKILSMGVLGLALSFLATSFVQTYYMLIISAFMYGVFTNFVNIAVLSSMMKKVSEEYRGRTFSLLESLSFASISLSYILATLLLAKMPIYIVIMINGTILMLISTFAYIISRKVKSE